MSPKRRNFLATASLVLLLLIFGLRPVEAVDRSAAWVAGWLGYPYRWLGELEIVVFGRGEAPDAARAMLAEESAIDLRRRELAAAVANREELKSRPGISADVILHHSLEGTFEINRGLRDGIAKGDPVTVGDALAGIVYLTEKNRAVVRYPWHRGTRLCAASAIDASARAVLAGAGEGLLKIDVARARDFPEGTILQLAPSPDGDALDLAAGFVIGSVRRNDDGYNSWTESDVTVRSERFLHVMVRTRGASASTADPEESETWAKITISPAGDATSGRKSSITKTSHVRALREGAAVVVDGWLVGRVERAAGPLPRVRFVEDRGFRVEAIFLPADGPPVALGMTRTLGEEKNELILGSSDALLKLQNGREGVLVTGASEAGVPKGIRIGAVKIVDGRLRVVRGIRGDRQTDAVVATAGDSKN